MVNGIRPLYYKLTQSLKCFLCKERLENLEAVCSNGHGICEECLRNSSAVCSCGMHTSNQHTLFKSLIANLKQPYTFFEFLPSIFECPVCYEQVKFPIHVCNNGHAVCHRCFYRTSKCPTCRECFAKKFNCDLNKVIKILEEPVECLNFNNGCSYTDIYSRLSLHEKRCQYKQLKCLFDSCSWSGMNKMLWDHVDSQHYHNIMKENMIVILLNTSSQKKVYLIIRNGEKFWLRYEYNTRGLYLGLQLLEFNQAERYTGQLELKNTCETTSMMFKILGLKSNLSSMVSQGQCLYVPTAIIERFKTKHGLLCRIDIKKEDSHFKTHHILYPALIAGMIYFCRKILT